MKLTARPSDALSGTAAVPGDKSRSHRALILGALADGTSRITGLLESDDVLATARAVEQLGATVTRDGADWLVTGGAWRSPAQAIDCGNSGTLARLISGAIAGRPGVSATLTGDASLTSRPMRRVTEPLGRMGARIEGGDTLPLTIHGGAIGGIDFVNEKASAQVKSALLLAGLGGNAPVRIVEPVPSRDHSEIMLAAMGVDVDVADTDVGRVVTLGSRRALTAADIVVGADPSSAAFPLVAAAVVPDSRVRVEGMNVNPLRTGLYETLEAMGARLSLSNERVQSGEIVADVELDYAELRPCDVPAAAIPAMVDEIPALAVACAFADGESVIRGLGELRVKESDRLSAILLGLIANGVAAAVDGDDLRIFGRGFGSVRGGGSVATHGDHRIAMAFLTLGLGARRPVEVDEAGMIATSFPGYVRVMNSIGASIA